MTSHKEGWEVTCSAFACALARQLYHEEDAHAKAVMLGAANSKALYEVVALGAAQPTCAYCGHAVPAHWLHIAWECVAWPDGRPHPPKDPVQQRLGWPAPHDTKERARSVLRWLARLRAVLLQEEYDT